MAVGARLAMMCWLLCVVTGVLEVAAMKRLGHLHVCVRARDDA